MTHNPATEDPAPEFNRPVAVERLWDTGSGEEADFEFRAEGAELKALAKRLGVRSVQHMSIRARLTPASGGGVQAAGRVTGAVTQTCVVTLEPVVEKFDEPFKRTYLPAHLLAGNDDPDPNPDSEDEPEVLASEINLGEVAAEIAALSLDPYPRKQDAAFNGTIASPPGEEPLTDEAARPFAKLADLRRQLGQTDDG